ncbi:DUF1329 domain-containing protein [Pseudomonas aeruginosa]
MLPASLLDRGSCSGHPFPMPSPVPRVMWNMKMRCRGVGAKFPSDHFRNFSTQRGNELASVDRYLLLHALGGKGSALFSSLGRLENATFFNYLEPAALAGQSAVQTAVAGEQATTFYYFLGQRQACGRMPS